MGEFFILERNLVALSIISIVFNRFLKWKLFQLRINYLAIKKNLKKSQIIWIDFRITKKIFGKQNRFSVNEKDLDLIKRVNTCMIISINMLASMQNK